MDVRLSFWEAMHSAEKRGNKEGRQFQLWMTKCRVEITRRLAMHTTR